MMKFNLSKIIGMALLPTMFTACSIPSLVRRDVQDKVPPSFYDSKDTVNSATIQWKQFFNDSNLIALIDTALVNNQELNITLQQIAIAKNEIRARKGEYLPFLNIGAGAGSEKVGEYTRQGAVEANHDIKSGTPFPDPLNDFSVSANLSWEVDIWKKLRNAKKVSIYKYLATIEGRNFMVTNLVAEISNAYYELMALDNQLEILKQYVQIQSDVLQIVKLQKMAGQVTELAVLRFEAELLKNQSRQYYIKQRIVEIENRINFLVGRYPQPINRNFQRFNTLIPDSIHAGIPSQLLVNRPDIKKAELELVARKLDIKVAKANFYPSFRIRAGFGYQAFDPRFLFQTPTSMLYSLAGEAVAPLINRNAIKANYMNTSAKQIQAVYDYERAVLMAYMDVSNQLSNINNLQNSYNLKAQQVDVLNQSITISTTLFKSARADYMEVLLTQRDALESKIELIETKQKQMHAMVQIYQALGGGWN
ncbi:MAG: TolC family protein [Bacteroidia bacterium]